MLVSYAAQAGDDCFRRKEFKIVKTTFGTPDNGDISIAFPDGIAIGKSFQISASWAHNRQKYPNARYSLMAGFANQADEDSTSFFEFGVQSFQSIAIKELNTSAANLTKAITIGEDTSTIKHKYFKIQLQMFGGNDNDANAPAFLEVRVYKIPIIADIKGKVALTDFDFNSYQTAITPLGNAMVYLTDESSTGEIFRTNSEGCFALACPNDSKAYKLNIVRLEDTLPLTFRNVKNIEPISIDARLIGPLYDKNVFMADNLENITYPASIFYGFVSFKLPLLKSYSMTNQRALISNWAKYEGECSELRNGDTDSARADLAIRSMIHNVFLDSITTNSMKLSGETVKFVTDAVLAMLSLEDFKKAIDEIGKTVEKNEVAAMISNKMKSIIASYAYMFTEDIITRMNLKGNGKKIGEAIKESLKKVKEGLNKQLAGKKVQEGVWKVLKDEAIKNVVVVPGNEGLMTAYIGYTQDFVEQSVQKANEKIYTGSNEEAATIAHEIFEKDKKIVDSLAAFCTELKLTSNWESTIASIGLAATSMVELWYKSKGKAVPEMVATGILISNMIKQLSVVTISKAAQTMLYTFADQEKVLDHGTRAIYDVYFDANNPNWKKFSGIAVQNPFSIGLTAGLPPYMQDYADLLASAVTAAGSDSSNFYQSYKSLLLAENVLNDSLAMLNEKLTAVSDSAFLAENQALLDAFKELKFRNEIDRLNIDMRMMLGAIQFSNPLPIDTLSMLKDTILAGLNSLALLVQQAETIVASKNMPAYFSCTAHNTSKQMPKPFESFELVFKLKNIGSQDAKNVKVAIYADTTVTVGQPQEFVFETVGPMQEIAPSWALTARDLFKPYIYYQIEVTADGLEKRVFHYNKAIESSDTLNPVTEEKSADRIEINSISPNPTSGIVNVSYCAPALSVMKISVCDVFGTILYSANKTTGASATNDISINLADNPAGVYFLRIDCNGASTTRKIIKN